MDTGIAYHATELVSISSETDWIREVNIHALLSWHMGCCGILCGAEYCLSCPRGIHIYKSLYIYNPNVQVRQSLTMATKHISTIQS